MIYIAMIRGIGPENPNTRNDKLKELFEKLGFADVRPIISSGNVVFSSGSRSGRALEAKIEKAMEEHLSFKNLVFVRSKADIERLIERDPFKGAEHGRTSYLLVTFLKKEPHELFSKIDVTKTGPEFMQALERTHGKAITSRTWKTIQRIYEKMSTA